MHAVSTQLLRECLCAEAESRGCVALLNCCCQRTHSSPMREQRQHIVWREQSLGTVVPAAAYCPVCSLTSHVAALLSIHLLSAPGSSHIWRPAPHRSSCATSQQTSSRPATSSTVVPSATTAADVGSPSSPPHRPASQPQSRDGSLAALPLLANMWRAAQPLRATQTLTHASHP